MKQSLSLKLSQQLTITPQLQRAIRLIQLSRLELELEVQQAVETNPMLELIENPNEPVYEEERQDALANNSVRAVDLFGENPTRDLEAEEWSADMATTVDVSVESALDDFPEELQAYAPREELYESSPSLLLPTALPPDQELSVVSESLSDLLLWQLNLTALSDRDKLIGTTIIEAIDSDGMLISSVGELIASVDDDFLIEPAEVEAVLKLIQQFEPAGVAARNLQECLTLQLRQLPSDTPYREPAITLVEQYLDLLAEHDFNTLARRSNLDNEDLKHAMALIQSLNPRPGSTIGDTKFEYIKPDVLVKRDEDRWLIELNADATPRVCINAEYASLIRRGDVSDDNTYLRNNLQEAKWFIKSLQRRNETLLKVATKIVQHQRGFLDYGDEAMKPLVLAEIAAAIKMHESTISRATTRKYIHTPRGIFELKYFFSNHVGTDDKPQASSTAIRAMIKKLLGNEDPAKPLSDSQITSVLLEQDITVARRTVAKYRDSMSIPSSNKRRRLV
jgi:RNA polymerase sigma-54 factor